MSYASRVKHLLLIALVAACSKTSSAPPPPPERTDLITRGGQPLTVVGKTLDVGDTMPDAVIYDAKLQPIQLSSLRGKLVVLSVVPSIDTKVCEVQSHRVSDALDLFPKGTEVYTISRDLPFAQSRFAQEAVMRIKMGSDYKEGSFGKAFGLEVKETGLLARSVWVIGPDGKILYRQIVTDQGTEPDYDALVAAAKKASAGGA